ncbi:hypothetical protein [Aquidulcibacter sp.]|uniref:hypothetical protein n=1 Tax=Aquidulcibacter sp. TaxID=2052990 RepID=UPI0025C1C95F|nr:hypothetical protein [Aquidulcibacter sp.]MCA3696505.1 hypothetical protein [Aquidulcibacter sp.]
MTERPILFSGPMVRAILEGRKTQTRRVLSYQPSGDVLEVSPPSSDLPRYWQFRYDVGGVDVPVPNQVGDTLWVREAWRPIGDAPLSECIGPEDIDFYATTDEIAAAIFKWRPSIHMPRWASRISLKVTAVKVERLQDISEADAIAEGILAHEPTQDDPAEYAAAEGRLIYNDPREAFCDLWISINGAYSWKANPWVVAYSFQRIKP